MPKSVEQRLKSATLVIATLRTTLRDLNASFELVTKELFNAEEALQANRMASQWRQSSEIARAWTLQGANVTGRHSGWEATYANANAVSNEPPKVEHGLCSVKAEPRKMYGKGCYVLDDTWCPDTVGATMAEAHRIMAADERFDNVIASRVHPDDVNISISPATAFNYEFLMVPYEDDARSHDSYVEQLENGIAKAFGVPSEFIGLDMADSPGSAAFVEARMEAGNLILQEVMTQTPEWKSEPCPPFDHQAALKKVLIGLDPNCTYAVWMWHAEQIADKYRHNTIGGIELLHKWSSGELGGFTSPVSYSEQTTNCVWAALTEAKHG